MYFKHLENLLARISPRVYLQVVNSNLHCFLGCLLGRPIVNKHRAYTFHRPSALWLAQIFIDVAFSAVQILMFSIIVYFACGLVREAGAFLVFYLVILTGYLAMTLFFRTIACLCSSFDVRTAPCLHEPLKLCSANAIAGGSQICGRYYYILRDNLWISNTIQQGANLAAVDLLHQ